MSVPEYETLPRNQIVGTLADSVRAHAAVVVIAPMGYGKTFAARALAAALGGTALFITVPYSPNDPRYLHDCVFDQLKSQGLDAHSVWPQTAALRQASFKQGIVQYLRHRPQPLHLVVDDYHNILLPEADSFLEELIRTAIPNLHLALFSRSRPGLRLEELRLKGLAVVFHQDILAFSREETRELFSLHDIRDPAVADEAWRYSEGWPAALRLCLRERMKTGAVRPNREIETLLGETIFSAFTDDEQAFLMRLALRDRFTVEEAAFLSADQQARTRLRRLHDKNSLIGYDPAGECYRLHGLFRDFLYKEFMSADLADKADCFRGAAECLLKQGDTEQAIGRLLEAGRDKDVLRILELFLQLDMRRLPAPLFDAIREAVLSLPWRLRLENPREYLAFIYFCFVGMGDAGAAPLLDEFEEMYRKEKIHTRTRQRNVMGEVEMLHAVLAFNDVAAMRKHYFKARQLLFEASSIVKRHLFWTFGVPHTSFLFVREKGQYLKMMKIVEEEWPYYAEMAGTSLGQEPNTRAEYLLETGDILNAGTILRNTLAHTRNTRQPMPHLYARFSLARIKIAAGDFNEAANDMEELRNNPEYAGHPDCAPLLDLILGYIHATIGQVKQMPRWLRDGDFLDAPSAMPQNQCFLHVVFGKALLADGNHVRLNAVVKNMAVHLAVYESLLGRIHRAALEAAAKHLKNDEEAMTPLKEAVELSRPDGLILPIAEYGKNLSSLLRRLHMESPGDEHLKKIALLAVRLARIASGTGKNKKGLLTLREEEIMRLVIKGKTNPDIAKLLGIAEITVKKILSSAYTRLGANNRVEATRIFDQTSRRL